MRSTCLSAAISCFALSKTGFESHGSTSKTFPLGVTILKADWPYQVSWVSMEVTKSKSVHSARGDEENDEAPMTNPRTSTVIPSEGEESRGPSTSLRSAQDDWLLVIRASTFDIRHFIYASPHE